MNLSDPASLCLLTGSKPVEEFRILVASSILVLSILSCCLNLLVFVIIVHYWKLVFKQQMFAHFVISMLAAGFLYSATNFWSSVPCTFSYCTFISSDTSLVLLSTPNTLSHWAYLFAAFSFSLYRFVLFISSTTTESATFVKICLYLPWILAFSLTVSTSFSGCLKRYNRWALQYTYNCSDCVMFGGFTTFIDVNFYGGQALPIVMFFFYGVIVVSVLIRRYNHQNTMPTKDVALAIQYLIICGFQYLSAFLFYIIPKVAGGHIWSVIAMNNIGVINVSVNPLVLLLFNGQVRSSLALLLCPRKRVRRVHRTSDLRSTATVISRNHFQRH